MTAVRTATPVVKTAPIKGMSDLNSKAAMDPQTAQWILNWDCENDLLRTRPGIKAWQKFSGLSPTQPPQVLALGVYGVGTTQKLYAYVANIFPAVGDVPTVYDVTTFNAPTSVYSNAAMGYQVGKWVQYGSRGSFVSESTSNVATFDGTTWSNGWLESSAGVKIPIAPVVYYKSRPYTIRNKQVYVGQVYQVAGVIDPAVSTDSVIFPINQVYQYNDDTAWIGTFSQADGQTNQEYIAFGNKAGEVLVYSGSYPNSDDWTIVAKLNIDTPVGYNQNATIPFQNDTLIMNEKGLISLKDLFNKGNEAALEEAISEPISTYWNKLVSAIPNQFLSTQTAITGIWAKRQRKIMIMFPVHVDFMSGSAVSGVSTILAVNTQTGAWSVHSLIEGDTAQRCGSIAYCNNEVYYANGRYVCKLDTTVDYDTPVLGGTIFPVTHRVVGPIESYGVNTVSVFKGYQPFLNQDFATFGLSLNIDFGRQVNGPVRPKIYPGFVNPLCDVGADGTFFNYDMVTTSQTTSVGRTLFRHEFYSVGSLLEKGGV